MNGIVFIGDELTAAGFRLTGVDTVVPKDDEAAAEALAEARKTAGLVIVTAAAARRIPAAQLEAAILDLAPIVAVIPDALLQVPPPDIVGSVRAVLGIEA